MCRDALHSSIFFGVASLDILFESSRNVKFTFLRLATSTIKSNRVNFSSHENYRRRAQGARNLEESIPNQFQQSAGCCCVAQKANSLNRNRRNADEISIYKPSPSFFLDFERMFLVVLLRLNLHSALTVVTTDRAKNKQRAKTVEACMKNSILIIVAYIGSYFRSYAAYYENILYSTVLNTLDQTRSGWNLLTRVLFSNLHQDSCCYREILTTLRRENRPCKPPLGVVWSRNRSYTCMAMRLMERADPFQWNFQLIKMTQAEKLHMLAHAAK